MLAENGQLVVLEHPLGNRLRDQDARFHIIARVAIQTQELRLHCLRHILQLIRRDFLLLQGKSTLAVEQETRGVRPRSSESHRHRHMFVLRNRLQVIHEPVHHVFGFPSHIRNFVE